ncbi:hypothetical protein ABTK52_18620, partial [Acinetobacter baumannii]
SSIGDAQVAIRRIDRSGNADLGTQVPMGQGTLVPDGQFLPATAIILPLRANKIASRPRLVKGMHSA